MRRPLLVVFCILLCISIFITKNNNFIVDNNRDNLCIEGIVKSKIEKEKYVEYVVGDFLIKDYSKEKNLPIGYNIKVSGKFKHFKNLKYDDFDYGRYIKSKGYEGVIYIDKYEILEKNFIHYNINKVKSKFSNTVKYLYKNKSEFLNSILIGEKEFIDDETKEIFSKTGVSHILALSGLHVSILITIIGFSMRGINKVYKLILLSVILIMYSIMVGQSPSIIRAVAYSIISYSAIFLFKRFDGITTLALIGSFLIIDNPYIIYNISFQLSFLATLSIIYFYGYMKSKIKFSVIALTISANILTVPILYLNFKNISLIAIISNVLVLPFLSIIIYMCILSILVLPISLGLSNILVLINSSIIDIINVGLEFLYGLDYSYIEFESSSKLLVAIYYIIIILYMIFKERKIIKEQKNGIQGYHQKYEQQRI